MGVTSSLPHSSCPKALGIDTYDRVCMTDIKDASFKFMISNRYTASKVSCFWKSIRDMELHRPCLLHGHLDNAMACVGVTMGPDFLVCCTPCQPFTQMRGSSTCTDHPLWDTTFGETDSVLSLAKQALPKVAILEQVSRFNSEFADLEAPPLQLFVDQMMGIKRGSANHFSGYVSLKLNSNTWVTCNRPRTECPLSAA